MQFQRERVALDVRLTGGATPRAKVRGGVDAAGGGMGRCVMRLRSIVGRTRMWSAESLDDWEAAHRARIDKILADQGYAG